MTIVLIFVITLAMLLCMSAAYIKNVIIPDASLDMSDFNPNLTSKVLAQNPETGSYETVQTLYGEENRVWVSSDEIPQYLKDAAVAIEDKRFYKHNGVDWVRTAKAISLMFTGRSIQGGSTLPQHIGSSLQIALGGWLMGVVIGTPLGIFMAWYKKVDLFVRPVFDLLRPVPGLAWIPLMIILFGIGITPKIVTVFLSAFVPCVLNSYTGIRQTKEVHLWVGQTFGASDTQMLVNIAIPTALPMIMTGIRVALGAAWTCIVAAEMLASTKGLGYMIQQARGIYRPDIIICGMIAIGVIGAVFSGILSFIESKIVKGVRRDG